MGGGGGVELSIPGEEVLATLRCGEGRRSALHARGAHKRLLALSAVRKGTHTRETRLHVVGVVSEQRLPEVLRPADLVEPARRQWSVAREGRRFLADVS